MTGTQRWSHDHPVHGDRARSLPVRWLMAGKTVADFGAARLARDGRYAP
jgi:hypothetical protein